MTNSTTWNFPNIWWTMVTPWVPWRHNKSTTHNEHGSTPKHNWNILQLQRDEERRTQINDKNTDQKTAFL